MGPHDPENQPTRTYSGGGSDSTLPRELSESGRIGTYRLVRKLGQGGMGMVFEAEQQDPKRLVALKVISAGVFASDSSIKLFEREVQALARLKHPGIAAIYEAGQTDEGQRFFAMELVGGQTLDPTSPPTRSRNPNCCDFSPASATPSPTRTSAA